MKNIVFWSGVWPGLGDEMTPVVQRPMAVYALAHWMRKNRFQCQVIDFLQWFNAASLIEFTEPLINKDTVCVAVSSVFFPTTPVTTPPLNILLAMQKLKLKFPNLKFVVGGPYATNYSTHFDHCFTGEGEDQFLKWCQEQSMGLSMPGSFFNIKTNDHQFHEDDCIMPNEALPLELGRGCIFKCSFCTYPNLGKAKGSYIRDMSLIENEISRNKEMFGTTNYVLLDDTVNEDPDKIADLAKINERLGYTMKWSGFLRLDLIWSQKNHQVLLESGLDQCYFGLESFHPLASRRIGKGWNGKHAKDFIPLLAETHWNNTVGIEGSFISGLPGEPVESIRESVQWVKDHNYVRGYFRGLRILNDSEFGKHPEKYNLTRKPWLAPGDLLGWEETGNPENNHLLHQELSKEFNRYLSPTWPMSGFYASSLYTLGYSREEVSNFKFNKFRSLVLARKDKFISDYKQKLKSVVNRQWT